MEAPLVLSVPHPQGALETPLQFEFPQETLVDLVVAVTTWHQLLARIQHPLFYSQAAALPGGIQEWARQYQLAARKTTLHEWWARKSGKGTYMAPALELRATIRGLLAELGQNRDALVQGGIEQVNAALVPLKLR